MKQSRLHPLDRLALRIQYSGHYHQVCRRMQRRFHPLHVWSAILLIVSATACVAPQPQQANKLAKHGYIYLEGAKPSHLSLVNSDPKTYRIASRIDLSLKPDIVP